MKDESCISFLQWALPRLQMRWPGFKKVRGQVCKRLARRLDELELTDLKRYRMYLEDNPLEWHILDSLCRITISRFYRDKGIYDSLCSHILPKLTENALRQGNKNLSCWCIGSASGEEPYSVSLLWDLSGVNDQGLDLNILATEVDQLMINRARNGCYPASSLREMPIDLITQAFFRKKELFCIKKQYKERVQFMQQDIRNTLPDSTFNLILCRNLVFTYFSRELQKEIINKIILCLKPGGALIIGSHEKLPGIVPGLSSLYPGQTIYRRET
jgi:chemotaxis protein methyltransferase CheR